MQRPPLAALHPDMAALVCCVLYPFEASKCQCLICVSRLYTLNRRCNTLFSPYLFMDCAIGWNVWHYLVWHRQDWWSGGRISVRRWRHAQDVISQRALGPESKYWWHCEEQMDILGNTCISIGVRWEDWYHFGVDTYKIHSTLQPAAC